MIRLGIDEEYNVVVYRSDDRVTGPRLLRSPERDLGTGTESRGYFGALAGPLPVCGPRTRLKDNRLPQQAEGVGVPLPARHVSAERYPKRLRRRGRLPNRPGREPQACKSPKLTSKGRATLPTGNSAALPDESVVFLPVAHG